MNAQFTIKQGASFAVALRFNNADGTPFDLTGATLAGQLRDMTGNLVAELAPAVTSPATGGVAAIGPLATAAWPAGRLAGDISLASGGVVRISDTFGVLVQPAVTVAGT